MKKLTIGIIAHVDSGKTTLSEAMLFTSGAIRNLGRVDKGDCFLDSDQIERRRGITIYSKQASFDYGETSFILLDTPGHSDFSAEMERTLQVLDYAILLISASDGIKGQSETLWKLLDEYNIPTFIFFNKMDQPGADKDVLLKGASSLLSRNIVDFGISDKEERDEFIAENSEEAMNYYLETGMLEDDMIRKMIRNREVFPCYFGSALKMTGVEKLMADLDVYTSSTEYPAEFGARAFKITHDDNGVRLTFIKVTGGKLETKDMIEDGPEQVKVNQIRVYSGNKYKLVTEAEAGDICAIEGLKNSHSGDTYGFETETLIPVLMPVLSYRIVFPRGTDKAIQLANFRIIEEESPELSARWDEDTSDIIICVMGEVQLEIIHDNYLERFGIDIAFDTGRVLYCETITGAAIGVGHFEPLRHYAEVQLLLEPLPEGSGLVFDAQVPTDKLAKNWQRLILTHLYEKEHRGVLTGSPITDMKITIIGGRAHLKHTEGGDFRQATYRAVRQGLMMAKSKLLEPYYRFMIDLPIDNLGRAMTDLDRMNARVSSPDIDSDTGKAILSGRVPVSAFKDYPREIAAYTRGLGHVNISPDGYGECHNEEEVIESIGYEPTLDIRNTPDSVFCSHGAGIIIPYNEVYKHMHVPFDKEFIMLAGAADSVGLVGNITSDLDTNGSNDEQASRSSLEELWLGVDEVDEIIASISRSGIRNKAVKPGWKRYGKRRNAASGSTHSTKTTNSGTRIFDKANTKYLLVDGYNVIFAWEKLNELAAANIDSARDSLLDILCNYQGITGFEVIAVFDAYRVKGHKTEFGDYNNIHVVYTAEAETADQYIEKFAHDNAKKHNVTVVTSDGLEQIIIRGEGCALISSREFEKVVEQASLNLRSEYNISVTESI